MPESRRHKVLIFIVAYAATRHIEALLERVEAAMASLKAYDPHVLVIDDASPDNTAALAKQFREKGTLPLTVLRNPVNQGYGGNQKIGYQYALRFGFDSVVLLHGDGQYPPEMIAGMLKGMDEQDAEIALGSRMLERKNALKGGMPYYKFLGNIVLTALQNKLLGMHLSEFHTGFRAYRTSFLARVPFSCNSNDFDFDTDILIQACLSKARIVEIPIPTHYGDEICHVNGLKYAGQILRNSLMAKIQQFHIYYHPKFDLAPDEGYASKVGMDSSHDFAIRHVDAYDTVLDIGGSSGHVAKVLREQKGCFVYGVDAYIHGSTASNYDQFTQMNLDRQEMREVFPQDKPVRTVLLLDVVEHLSAPEHFMTSLRLCCAPQNSRIIITTGNVGFILTRLSLLLGNFNYGKRGILDFTHKRLFTFGSLKRLLAQYGYTVEKMEGIPVPLELVFPKYGIGTFLTALNRLAIRIFRPLFSYQIAVVARPQPTLDMLLDRAEAAPFPLPEVKTSRATPKK